jgi:predicted transcriptional regulator of viral defense system
MEYSFIQHLAQKGVRIFTTQEAKMYAQEIGMQPGTILDRLYRMNKKGIIERLMSGLYCLGPEFLSGIPIHEYEIAAALATPSSIAFLSAFSYHKLTDQISSIIYVLSTIDPEHSHSRNMYTIRGIRYRIIRVQQEDFFGIERKWIGRSLIPVTDLERTLIDGLAKPKYCAGIREVLDGYSQVIDQINIPKIISYALRMSDSVCKRLGYVLSTLNVDERHLEPLFKRVTPIFIKLDPTGPQKGAWNRTWFVMESL